MGFRDAEEARAHRIRALETELEERDREIATLRAKLEERDGTEAGSKEQDASPPEGDAAPSPEPMTLDPGVPKIDRWTVPVHRPHRWLYGLVYLTSWAGCAYFVHLSGVDWTYILLGGWPALLPCLYWFHRRYFILDKEAGTITDENRLIIRWKGQVLPYRGQSIRLEREYRSREEGESYWIGKVFLGEVKLFQMREEHAIPLAHRIAALLEIPYAGPPRTRPKKRKWWDEASAPVILYFILSILAAAFIYVREFILD